MRMKCGGFYESRQSLVGPARGLVKDAEFVKRWKQFLIGI